MTRRQLEETIFLKKTFLCVGLDTDPARIPASLRNTTDPVFEFNKVIIDATRELCVAYKPNIAFYESLGPGGWHSLEKTLAYIPKSHFTIADAKRGDIGNSSEKYAETFFRTYGFDAVTVSPYMGQDSLAPFLAYEGKWTIVLALTSNPGAADFQKPDGLFQKVIESSRLWGTAGNMMYVAGATQAGAFQAIRRLVPEHFLLVPGVGTQGGSLEAIASAGMTPGCGLLVNASRSILYASSGNDFAEQAHAEASRIQNSMEKLLPARTGKPAF